MVKHYGEKIQVSYDETRDVYQVRITNTHTGADIDVTLPGRGLYSESQKRIERTAVDNAASRIANLLRQLFV